MSIPSVYHVADLQKWSVNAPIQLAVLGDPVAHSASPPMHMAALKACSLPHTYGRLHVRPDELAPTIQRLAEVGFIGVNLTIPHKTAILPLLDEIDPHAQIMGAVNTLVFKPGQLTGFNTDGRGLVRAIADDFGVQLGSLRTLIVGAGGGAGRAIALQCALEGCPEITLVNRTREKADSVAHEINSCGDAKKGRSVVHVFAGDDPALQRRLEAVDLIIQCSSLGMNEGDASPIPLTHLRAEHLVYDTIYSRETQLVQDARALGARTSNGLSMLLHQGALAFEIWFERPAPIDEMRSALLHYRATPSH
ncbi:MAG: shikimate dehydrogenase [Verrucomicrobiota bacterium]